MQDLRNLAELIKTQLKIDYNAEGVQFLEGYIERNKAQFSGNDLQGFINSCSAFLGQCIINNYGGKWEQDESGYPCVVFDKQNNVFPFAKVTKQVKNGLEDSIYSFYKTIPLVFKNIGKPKKKWWWF